MKKNKSRSAAVLAEIIMIVFIIALFSMIAMINLSEPLAKESFKSRANNLVKLFQMAATSAAETGKRYEIIIDAVDGYYMLREITSGLVTIEDVREEEIIATGEFTDKFQVSYVLFDDGVNTQDIAYFRVGKSGWQCGGKISLFDENGNEYTIVINRMNRMVQLDEGDTQILDTRTADDMMF